MFVSMRILMFLTFLLLNVNVLAFKLKANIEDAQQYIRVNRINLSGNIHTKDFVILRELDFVVGEKIKKNSVNERIEHSKQNLLNTSLFNFVVISISNRVDNQIDININLDERWYFWPYPVFEHADRNLSSFIDNGDWTKVDYGIYFLVSNFRGRNETLKLKAISGYKNQFSLYYYKPYIDENNQFGAGISIDYFRNSEIAYVTSNNELSYLKFKNRLARYTFGSSFFISYRPKIYNTHKFAIEYNRAYVQDSVSVLNANYFGDGKNSASYIKLTYRFERDKRDSKTYPLDGYYFDFNISKRGGDVIQNNIINDLYLKSSVEKYFSFDKKLYFSSGIESKISIFSEHSYYLSEALGFDNYLRGMEYYVMNGQNYFINKNNLKYEILPKTIKKLNFIPFDRFNKIHYSLYCNLFFDTGLAYSDSYFKENENTMLNEVLYSGGIGVDLVTYYDKVFRIEYSVNRYGEHGFFFHIGAPIVCN